jgi:hypothetical protein
MSNEHAEYWMQQAKEWQGRAEANGKMSDEFEKLFVDRDARLARLQGIESWYQTAAALAQQRLERIQELEAQLALLKTER